MTRRTSFFKDPDSTVDFVFDWAARTNGRGGNATDYLAEGETITEQTTTVDSDDLTIDSSSIVLDDTAVSVWVSGGVDGGQYRITNSITTSAGRTDHRTLTVRVTER